MIKAKKSLGQNFLKSQKAISEIINAGHINPDDTILEIGPGKGVLTEKLLEKAGKVIAIEKDLELISFLNEKFANEISSKKLLILNEDILEFSDFSILTGTYKIIANIPYYITGAIIRKFLESKFQPERMVLLVQKEVAERIVARDKKESILSISVKAYGLPKYIEKVSARYFSPQPKVDSAILLIANISKKLFTENNISELVFFELVKTGFAHKRKVLSSNLKPLLGGRTPKLLNDCGIAEKARAEDVNLSQWVCLTRNK
jgi:16S rRNA (adenine1518-N6/adenine1519-N6)-dimethyltransferase